MLTTLPFISIIIPVYNDSEALLRCLAALENQTYPAKAYEVIVIDNNSTEDIAAVTSQFDQVRLAHEPQQGSYAARNRGLSIAKGEVIGFTDSDCIPETDWIEQGVKALQETQNCGLVAGKIKFHFKNSELPTASELFDSTRFLQQQRFVEQMHFGATANVFTYKAVFEQVGLFNDRLKSGGDQEWGNRVFKGGYRLAYAEQALISHPARSTLKELRKKMRRVFQGEFNISDRAATPTAAFVYETLLSSKPSLRYIWEVLGDESIGSLKYRANYAWIYIVVKYERLEIQSRLYLKAKINKGSKKAV